MKNKRTLILPFIFFFLVNTSYYWENLPGFWDFGIILVLFLGFILLISIYLFQLVLLIRKRFKDKDKISFLSFLTIILMLTAIWPRGIINFEKFEGQDLLIAQAEGAANCTSTLKIKKNNRFVETIVCFGVERYKGNYTIAGDSIKLEFDKLSSFESKYALGILKLNSNPSSNKIGELLYYHDMKDTIPSEWVILKNEIK